MKALTIRNVDDGLARALERERRARGQSLNATVLGLLRRALGVDDPAPRSNGLRELAGTWSEEEHAEFEANVAAFEQVDEELWR